MKQFCTPMMETEVEATIISLKNKKVQEKTEQQTKFWNLEDNVNIILYFVFNEILKKKWIPNEWNTSKMILIHKKGDRQNINNIAQF